MHDSFITRGTVHAPELSGAIAWLNVDAPLSLNALRGHVVLLDFWTYCCINCMHVQPLLRELERRFEGQPFVVVGVHSGKFSAERDPERIAEAIGRYGMRHPVAVDDDMRIWSRYGIRSWPTLVVVRPDGTIAATAPGEPDLERLSAFVGAELERGREAGRLASQPVDIPRTVPSEVGALHYPGKVAALPDGRIAISDSGHHRVLVCGPTGRVEVSAGSGRRGLLDGPAASAAFDDPQGLCWFEDALYVADARNHAIRRIDGDGQVTTVAGTGELGEVETELALTDATSVALRSPWDLCVVDDSIFVAMAGSHQIWRYLPRTRQIEIYAGTGVEALLDGPRATSAWAQPSGLALLGRTMADGRLVVADSESSAIRSIVLATGEVETHMGQGLFDFGDADGDLDAAALQHPLGVAADGDDILIADTYNGKVKRLHFAHPPTVQTVLDGFSEPGAIAVTEDGLWLVANTNGHQVCGVRDNVVSSFSLRGAPPVLRGVELPQRRPSSVPPPQGWFDQHLEPRADGLRPGPAEVRLEMHPPEGTSLAEGSPLRVEVEVSRRSDLLSLPEGPHLECMAERPDAMTVSIPVHVGSLCEDQIDAEMVAVVDHVICLDGDQAGCVTSRLHLRIPLRLQRDHGVGVLSFAVMTNRAGD